MANNLFFVSLKIAYLAIPDETTPLNLTNHSYFNLSRNDDVLGHELFINATGLLAGETDGSGGMSGEILPINSTAYSSLCSAGKPAKLSKFIPDLAKAQPKWPYGDALLLSSELQSEPVFAAEARDIESGRRLMCFTTEPVMQTYFGNLLDGSTGHPQ